MTNQKPWFRVRLSEHRIGRAIQTATSCIDIYKPLSPTKPGLVLNSFQLDCAFSRKNCASYKSSCLYLFLSLQVLLQLAHGPDSAIDVHGTVRHETPTKSGRGLVKADIESSAIALWNPDVTIKYRDHIRLFSACKSHFMATRTEQGPNADI